ncbi:hypothetical protein GGI21_002264 [Coemansia aciculifera]|uniref:Uncharacterized protein n=1 Tax=Coemansia aciculifera TaxID=417176 RepID=A0ACC1M197_9FUNG|nr:hypothetical protein IWW38_003403 [Coemansia aciculifera]KAJ2909056.1 hypothetical protein GGI21_002264 [Coemansia aciculifera]
MIFPSSQALSSCAVILAFAGHATSVKWSFTLATANERAHACQEQISFCYNTCKSVVNTATNFCNMRTMGWNCACAGGAAERKVRHYEWPIAVAECRASLATCNAVCADKTNGNDRVACYTSCTTDYLCNTVEAPVSNLRVQAINEKPAGYIPPTDDRDIDMPVGMKFGSGASDQDGGSKKQQTLSDPGLLPKSVPRDDDNDAAKAGGKGGNQINGKGAAGGSGTRGLRPGFGSGFGVGAAASSSVGNAQQLLAGGLVSIAIGMAAFM